MPSSRSLASPVDRAAVVVALQGVLLVVFAVAYAVEGLRGEALSRPGAELGAAMVGAAGAGLVLAARGLRRRRTWARGPVVAVQLVSLLTAFSLMSTPLAGPATVAVVVAVVVVYLLFTAEARAELDRRAAG